ncbi:MAG: DUF1178 family protein [Rhizomicrobium sp.]
MIVYALKCAADHTFDSWFKSSNAFDEQAAAGKLVCPICMTRKVEKAPMAPSLGNSIGERNSAPEEMRKARRFMTGLRKYVEANADYVGPGFAEEARKIHYGEAEQRQIYGEATVEEAKSLIEEGVDVAPLPPGLSDAN